MTDEPKITVYYVRPDEDFCRLVQRTLDEALVTARILLEQGDEQCIIERGEMTQQELDGLEEFQGW